ncbi:hypothetical protein BGZ74_010990 [Mortierella antarctica]|nr:hypothetical protein BGZ74_010990 [Mortierella antarctica]
MAKGTVMACQPITFTVHMTIGNFKIGTSSKLLLRDGWYSMTAKWPTHKDAACSPRREYCYSTPSYDSAMDEMSVVLLVGGIEYYFYRANEKRTHPNGLAKSFDYWHCIDVDMRPFQEPEDTK